MNRILATKTLVFVTCSLFIIAYFAPFGPILSAQPKDDWVAHPMYISLFASSLPPTNSFSPSQIRTAYGLPSSGGTGATIAIIDAYNASTVLNDLTIFSNQYNLPPPTTSNFEIYNMSKNIVENTEWTTETCLDVEWAHAIAPDAKILLVQAISNNGDDLLSAINYARSRADVVTISMSWGTDEPTNPNIFDAKLTSSYGAVFFAASGDNGSEINWPASSANVVAVGGTTLSLKSDGTVIFETAWNGSGGGVSIYEPAPAYQTNYGLTSSERTIPDVSYNANPLPGFAVYSNSSWHRVGGTSAGAPQWAAIHALGRSATNANLYDKAKLAYSSYFRDITLGSNGGYSASTGYDLVTGLGSPLTSNFATLSVFPTSGPSEGAVTLSGIGFLGTSANISYLNPVNSSWTAIISNLITAGGTFSYTFNAPDLLRNNLAGDNQPISDNILFRAQDNGNGRSYNTSVPYMEWRRGLAQIGNVTATGLFGNNTDLATSVFVQNGDLVPVVGNWFNPGNISLLWDDVSNVGTTSTDSTGFFNTTMLVPTTSAGPHVLTINDGVSNFCINITRLPSTANNYVAGWHTSDFPINLTRDYSVNETFYSINSGPIFNVTANGQPTITTEGSSNQLEYWSTWNVYGTITGTTDLPHVTLTGIKLDKTAPAGTITTNPTTSTTVITLTLSATDAISGIAQMRFSNDNATWSNWEPYATSKAWNLLNGNGQKTVTVQYMDNAGLTSLTYSCSVTLQTPQPTLSPTIKPAITDSPSPTPTPLPTATPQAPELNIEMVLVLLAASTLMLALIFKRSRK